MEMWCLLSVLSARDASGMLDLITFYLLVNKILESKRPFPQDLKHKALPSPDLVPPPLPNSIMFDYNYLIRYSAKHAKGSANPSGLDAQ